MHKFRKLSYFDYNLYPFILAEMDRSGWGRGHLIVQLHEVEDFIWLLEAQRYLKL